MTSLADHRIVLLGGEITPAVSHQLIAQLVLLDAESREQPIDLYINSPGGSVLDGLAIVDAMLCINAPVVTTCIGQAASMAAWILAAGAPGLRAAAPHAEIMLHQMRGGVQGEASDLHVYAQRAMRLQEELIDLLVQWTRQGPERIRRDMERDFYMTAGEAKDYGLVDRVLVPTRGAPAGEPG